jgi:hypothetical protein
MDCSAAAVMQKSGRAATAAAALLHTKEGVLMMAVRRRVVVRVAKRINVVLDVLIIIVLLGNGSVQESGLLWQKRQSLLQIKKGHMSCMWLIRHASRHIRRKHETCDGQTPRALTSELACVQLEAQTL